MFHSYVIKQWRVAVVAVAIVIFLCAVPAAFAADDSNNVNGWQNIDGNTYYFENGEKVLGEKAIQGDWYYFSPELDGRMNVGWAFIPSNGGKWCYYDSLGHMVHGQYILDNNWYYFDEYTGATQYGFKYIYDQAKWVCYDSITGVMLKGQNIVDNHWYSFDVYSGAVQYGFVYQPDDQKWVYYDRVMGWMIYGQQCIDGHWYNFDWATGAVTYGFVYQHDEQKWVLYDRAMGWMLYGEQMDNGNWYYLQPGTGAVSYGWVLLPSGKCVYYNEPDGVMVHGPAMIEGRLYMFDWVTGELKAGGTSIHPPLSFESTAADIGAAIKAESVDKIQLVGDSLTAGVGSCEPIYYSDAIALDNGNERYYQPEMTNPCWGSALWKYCKSYDTSVVNLGIPEITTVWLNDNKQSLALDQSDVIIVMLGTNDRFAGESVNTYTQAVRSMLTYLSSKTDKLLVMSPPRQCCPENHLLTEDQIDSTLETLCRENNWAFISMARDFNTALDQSMLPHQAFYRDNTHLNEYGNALFFDVLSQRLGL